MARKQPSFRQLFDYMHEPTSVSPVLLHNLYAEAGSSNQQAIISEFYANNNYLPKRKNGNALYHEVIVLDRQESILKQQQGDMLLDIAEYYLNQRAPHQLAYGRVHYNTDYTHIHLMVSANGVRSTQRKRLSKSQFREVQEAVEAYQIEKYPELGSKRLYAHSDQKSNEQCVISNRGFEAGKRQDTLSQKAILCQQLDTLLRHVVREDELHAELKSMQLELYQRGSTYGVVDMQTNMRHRLKTLGLDKTFADALERFSTRKERQSELATLQGLRALHEADRELDCFEEEQEKLQ